MPFFPPEATRRRPFDPGRAGYDAAQAWWLAALSELAYRNKRYIVEALREAGFSSVAFVDARSTQGYLAAHPGMLPGKPFAVLAFRGTENDWADILADLTFLRTRLPDEPYSAHAGFVYAFKEVWGASVEGLDSPEFPVRWYGARGVSDALEEYGRGVPVFFTGHSLGGAIATVAAHYWPPRALYTFGSPRVADRALARRFAARGIAIYRVVNSTDAVARVPFALLGFRHVGELVYFTRGGRRLAGRAARVRFRLGSLWTLLLLPCFAPPLALVSVAANFLVAALIRPRLFVNHRIAEYRRKLEAPAP
ncbi:MAG TPA: lipase family protein [Burkholderiales bacterium]|nr:lipase family protein [Burkholderiales bacterium]